MQVDLLKIAALVVVDVSAVLPQVCSISFQTLLCFCEEGGEGNEEFGFCGNLYWGMGDVES